MRQWHGEVEVQARTPGLHEITGQLTGWIGQQAVRSGLFTVFCRHTSASLLIQENAAPAARMDLEGFFDRIAPENPVLYTHKDEGPDDMPAHIRAALTQSQLSIPVDQGQLTLGTWQGIFLFEHRREPPPRRLALHLIGES